MKFDVKKQYYKNINEVLESSNRKQLLENNMKQLDFLYYNFKYVNIKNMCNFSIFNEIIDKEIFNPSKIDVIVEVDKNVFEDFVDSQKIKDISESINIYFNVANDMYYYNNGWKTTNLKIRNVISINDYIEDYEL